MKHARAFTTENAHSLLLFSLLMIPKGTYTTFLLFESASSRVFSRKTLETRKSILVSQVVSIFKGVLCYLPLGLIAQATSIEKHRSPGDTLLTEARRYPKALHLVFRRPKVVRCFKRPVVKPHLEY